MISTASSSSSSLLKELDIDRSILAHTLEQITSTRAQIRTFLERGNSTKISLKFIFARGIPHVFESRTLALIVFAQLYRAGNSTVIGNELPPYRS